MLAQPEEESAARSVEGCWQMDAECEGEQQLQIVGVAGAASLSPAAGIYCSVLLCCCHDVQCCPLSLLLLSVLYAALLLLLLLTAVIAVTAHCCYCCYCSLLLLTSPLLLLSLPPTLTAVLTATTLSPAANVSYCHYSRTALAD